MKNSKKKPARWEFLNELDFERFARRVLHLFACFFLDVV